MTVPKVLDVYNLEFEWPDEKMEIGPYVFVPADDYCARYRSLQHLIDVSGGYCGNIKAVTGQHQVTGYVEVPNEVPPAALGWRDRGVDALSDVLFFLTLFTGRKVFALRHDEAAGPIIADPREFYYGGGVGLSLGQVTRPGELGDEYAQNLSGGTSSVLNLIRTEGWRSMYGEGKYLFLFVAACHRQIVETSYLLCWTIWEHLFRLHNAHWISTRGLRSVDVREKMRYILARYGVREKISDEDAKNVDRLTLIRHRLAHDGSFEQDADIQAADLFIRVTEFVIAKTLGLEPTEVFSPMERWDRFSRGDLL